MNIRVAHKPREGDKNFCTICHSTDTEPIEICSRKHTVHKSCLQEWIEFKKLPKRSCLICGENLGVNWSEIFQQLLCSVCMCTFFLYPLWVYVEYMDEE